MIPLRLAIVSAIVHKELKEAVRNRTVLLVVFLPLMASFALSRLQAGALPPVRVAVPAPYVELFSRSLPSDLFRVEGYTGPGDPLKGGGAARWDAAVHTAPGFLEALAEGQPAAVRVTARPGLGAAARAVLSQLPLFLQTLGAPAAVQVEMEGMPPSAVQSGFLSLWLTVTATMVGIMVMGGNFAEEKERGTLLALLTTPAGLPEVFTAKALSGTFLTTVMAGLMAAAHGVAATAAVKGLVVLLPGAFCFTLAGLLLGFLAPNQATARSYGTLVYLPLLVPVFAYDASASIARWAGAFPSYHLWAGLEKALSGAPAPEIWRHGGPLLLSAAAALAVLMATAARRRF